MNLTKEQKQAIDQGEGVELSVEGRECILLSKAIYEQMKNELDDDEMDYGPMTIEEMDLLADEAAEIIAKQEPVDHFEES